MLTLEADVKQGSCIGTPLVLGQKLWHCCFLQVIESSCEILALQGIVLVRLSLFLGKTEFLLQEGTISSPFLVGMPDTGLA